MTEKKKRRAPQSGRGRGGRRAGEEETVVRRQGKRKESSRAPDVGVSIDDVDLSIMGGKLSLEKLLINNPLVVCPLRYRAVSHRAAKYVNMAVAAL